MEAKLLNKKDAARYLKVSCPTIYNMLEDGRLTAYTLSGRRTSLISSKELDEYKEIHKSPSK